MAVLVAYAFFWGVLKLPFRMNPKGVQKPLELSPRRFSVIIPFRNEKGKVGRLISSLISSPGSEVFKEIIAVNDHSEDGGDEEVVVLQSKYSKLRIIQLLPGETGKKMALMRGMEATQSKWCLILDADVVPDARLGSYLQIKPLPDSGMLVFPVLPCEGSGLLASLQFWEFVALMELTRGSCRIGFPMLANGACLAFSRAEALEAKGMHPRAASSGDDLALLQHFRRIEATIEFATMGIPAVRFFAPRKLQKLCSQRLRWTSKLGAYPDTMLFMGAACIGLANVVAFACILAWTMGMDSYLLIVPGVKFAIDLLIVLTGSTGKKIKVSSLLWLPIALLIYPLYSSFIVFASFWAKPEWKGRKVQLSNAG